jgi:hypothetical protein
MLENEILEGNKLIAEFMGAIADTGETEGWFGGIMFPHGYDRTLALKYNSSWDWLMPVIAKVTKLIREKQYIPIGKHEEYSVQCNAYEEQWRKLFDYQAYSFFIADIESVYKAIVEFIKWYNNTKKC